MSSRAATCTRSPASPDDLNAVREALEARFGDPELAALVWNPQNTVEVGEGKASGLFRLLDALDDNDDVQNVSANFDVSDEVLAKQGGLTTMAESPNRGRNPHPGAGPRPAQDGLGRYRFRSQPAALRRQRRGDSGSETRDGRPP